MGKIIFFTGGCRSGKSELAEKYILESNCEEKIYFATAIPFDDEMKERIKKHLIRRGNSWITIEAYNNLLENLKKYISNEKNKIFILFDCISNMISNIILTYDKNIDWNNVAQDKLNEIENYISDEIERFVNYLKNSNINCVFVGNEVGLGLVPDYPLGRYFRDINGIINKKIALYSDEVYFIVSGIQTRIK